MEIQQLKFFLAVAAEKNLTRASKKLNTVQSNTTVKLKQLEAELGHPLFIRSKKGMELTERGVALVPYAKSILETESNIMKEMESDIEPNGALSIGCLDTFIRLYMREKIPNFVRQFPEVNLQIQTGFNAPLIQKLTSGEIELAGIVGALPSNEFEVVFSAKEKMVFLSRSKISADSPLLILGKDCFFGRTLQAHFNHTRPVLNIASIESILTCVDARVGITLLPESIIPKRYEFLIKKRIRKKCEYFLIRKRKRPAYASEREFSKFFQ